MKDRIQKFKNEVKTRLPDIAAGALLGVAGAAYVANRMYHPKDKVAIQLPKGVLETMRDEDKGLVITSNEGWFTLKHHASHPRK